MSPRPGSPEDVPPTQRPGGAPSPAPRPKRPKAAPKKGPKAVLVGEPIEPQGRAWLHLLASLSDVMPLADGTSRTRGDMIGEMVKAGAPPEAALQSQEIAPSVLKHWKRLALLAIERWGFEVARVNERYGPMIRLLDALDVARATGVCALAMTWRAAADRDPRAAHALLQQMAPEHFDQRRRGGSNEDDVVPVAAPAQQLSSEPQPIRVFMPAEVPLLAAPAPTSGRVKAPGARPRPSGPRLVVEEEDDFPGEVIEAEGRAVG